MGKKYLASRKNELMNDRYGRLSRGRFGSPGRSV
jgi:hypothetical protein